MPTKLAPRPLCRRKSRLERCGVDTFALKERYGCSDLVRGLGIKRAEQQPPNELDVSRFIEGCNVDALTQHFKAIIALRRQDGAQSLEQQLPPLPKTVPLA
jgi:hypothetical protein